MALCMPPTPGPILKRWFCDCSRMPYSWTIAGHKLFSNVPEDLSATGILGVRAEDFVKAVFAE